jgi:hypothetical protein
MRILTGLIAAAAAVVVLIFVGGMVSPMQEEDRNVPGATTGKGQSKLIE